MTKNLLLTICFSAITAFGYSQNKFVFTDTQRIPCPPVSDQQNSGTCWCFSTLSFMESEMIKNGMANPPNLSEMFIVRNNYYDRAKKYIMLHGFLNFSQGSYFIDNFAVMKNYGLMPEEAFPNLKDNQYKISHTQLEKELKNFVDSVGKDNANYVNPNWDSCFNALLDKHFYQIPEDFEYNGQRYTPKSFAEQYCKLNYNDYIQVTSFSHHDFYKLINLELPDNWRNSLFLNVPIDEMITIIDNSLATGHTVLWAADISENGFDTRRGYALLPGIKKDNLDKKAIEAYQALSPEEQEKISTRLTCPGIEMNVTQESRQADFLSRKTTDDHGMQIIGTATDQNNNKYYIVKNSWGTYNNYDGYIYVSVNYVKAKTTGLLVNKIACKDQLKKSEVEF